MDAADFFITEGIGGGQANIVSVMVGVARLLNRNFPLGCITISISYPFVGDILVEWIIGHERQSETIIQHRIAQGKVEIAVANCFGQSLIVGEPLLVAGIQQERMPMVQITVDRNHQPMSPSVEIWYVIRP